MNQYHSKPNGLLLDEEAFSEYLDSIAAYAKTNRSKTFIQLENAGWGFKSLILVKPPTQTTISSIRGKNKAHDYASVELRRRIKKMQEAEKAEEKAPCFKPPKLSISSIVSFFKERLSHKEPLI